MCVGTGYDLTGCEIDADYYGKAMERIKEHQTQSEMFDAVEMRGRQAEEENDV
jgi:hypothetical protein